MGLYDRPVILPEPQHRNHYRRPYITFEVSVCLDLSELGQGTVARLKLRCKGLWGEGLLDLRLDGVWLWCSGAWCKYQCHPESSILAGYISLFCFLSTVVAGFLFSCRYGETHM